MYVYIYRLYRLIYCFLTDKKSEWNVSSVSWLSSNSILSTTVIVSNIVVVVGSSILANSTIVVVVGEYRLRFLEFYVTEVIITTEVKVAIVKWDISIIVIIISIRV